LQCSGISGLHSYGGTLEEVLEFLRVGEIEREEDDIALLDGGVEQGALFGLRGGVGTSMAMVSPRSLVKRSWGARVPRMTLGLSSISWSLRKY
jgi:hypothetical protein